ncbi:unnamed protein product [Fusarium venenatum]|uniref:Uncharacterized protein n=1 Tax=Fusarium venenatum TaxID=56646 RepID=A0A2L2TJA8_9HYPO|nr:uncharacterized protein FVRRES_13118 [Fusarium venenatum]CEI40449.1 unnamed protein product [Fusarium venenatum]
MLVTCGVLQHQALMTSDSYHIYQEMRAKPCMFHSFSTAKARQRGVVMKFPITPRQMLK